mgnify:CR=1 FL=1
MRRKTSSLPRSRRGRKTTGRKATGLKTTGRKTTGRKTIRLVCRRHRLDMCDGLIIRYLQIKT